ncbi:hypothetical protein DB41_DP00250 [Neochlamydia sp. TUME1]|jgi:hypothetical protein|nr:hypothetical protein DB41_DP00250 [Neochlamydia sp. TUME1]
MLWYKSKKPLLLVFLNVQGISLFALKVNIDFFFKSSLEEKGKELLSG